MNKVKYTVCIFLSIFLFAMVNSTLGALLTRYIDHYQLVESQQGIPVSMLNIGCITALLSSLWVMGRIKKPHLMWIASAATVLLLIPLGLPPGFSAFSALFLVLGISVGYTDTLASSSIADLYDGKRAAIMMCTLHAVFGFAGIASPLTFQLMMNRGLAWNRIYTTLFFMGAAILAYVIPVGAMRARHAPVHHATGQRITRAELVHFFTNRGRLMILCAIFFYGFYLSGITIWIDRYIRVSLNSEELGALSLSLFWFGLTLSRLISPLLNIKPANLIRWSSFLTAALLAAGILTGNAPLMCGVGALAGFLSGAIIPLLLHIACQQYKTNTLIATTFLFLSLYIAQSSCPPFMGFASSAFGLTAAMLTCPVSIALCGFAVFAMEKWDRPQRQSI